jgi:hypothetical protein
MASPSDIFLDEIRPQHRRAGASLQPFASAAINDVQEIVEPPRIGPAIAEPFRPASPALPGHGREAEYLLLCSGRFQQIGGAHRSPGGKKESAVPASTRNDRPALHDHITQNVVACPGPHTHDRLLQPISHARPPVGKISFKVRQLPGLDVRKAL